MAKVEDIKALIEPVSNKNKQIAENMYKKDFWSKAQVEFMVNLVKLLKLNRHQEDLVMPMLEIMSSNDVVKEVVRRAVESRIVQGLPAGRINRFNPTWSFKSFEQQYAKARYFDKLKDIVSRDIQWFPKLSDDLCHQSFRDAIPKNLWGSQITNSHRLAIEGFRLEHCIGSSSYKERAMKNSYVYLSMVAAGKRWTVSISEGTAKRPARVENCLGKANAEPTKKEKEMILRRFMQDSVEAKEETVKVEVTYKQKIKARVMKTPEHLESFFGKSKVVLGIDASFKPKEGLVPTVQVVK